MITICSGERKGTDQEGFVPFWAVTQKSVFYYKGDVRAKMEWGVVKSVGNRA